MKKLLCLFLTVLLIASIFVACDTGDGGNTESPSETLAEKNTVTPSEKVTAEETVSAFGTESVPPTDKVTDTHTTAPTEKPTVTPTEEPTVEPTVEPTEESTYAPTEEPTAAPTEEPTSAPTEEPTSAPTDEPTAAPTEEPTSAPTDEPTVEPTEEPTVEPIEEPTSAPTEEPTSAPTEEPTLAPTEEPTTAPTEEPTLAPTEEPTLAPTEEPTSAPTEEPTSAPTEDPTIDPSTPPEEPEINYGTLENPVTTTYAYGVNSTLRNEEFSASPFYVKGTVTAIESTVNYYKNVYITDGITNLHIYTINMGDGVTGFEVGDVIVAYGYFVNYNDDIGLATYKPDPETRIYVYAVKVEGGEGGDTPPSSSHTYTDFTSDEKAMFTDTFGFVIPFIPNDEYYVDDLADYGLTGVNFYAFDNTPAEFDAYRALFSDYTYDGTETDQDGDTWYFYYKGNAYVEMCYYLYEDAYIVDVYVYLTDEGEDPTTAPEESTETESDAPASDNGTLESPLSVTQAYNANKGLAEGSSSSDPYYVVGTVESIGNTGSYYQNVYITDGATDLLIYTISMGDGITGFEVGDTIVAYGYFKNYKGTIEMATNAGTYVHAVKVEAGEGGGSTTPPASEHTYTDFSAEDKTFITDRIGFVIPFLPNNEYILDEYVDEEYGEYGIYFSTTNNTQSEFNAYRALFSSYTYDGTDNDGYGDAWYFYSKGDVSITMCFYYWEEDGNYYLELWAYTTDSSTGGNGGESGGNTTPSDLITNDGAGLPEDDGDGIFDVDFTKGQYVQNVTDQGYYLDGCPTTGTPAVLVIPVEFSDVPAGEGYTTDNIEKIFNGTDNDTTYHSVHDYFFMSSYETLDLQITVLDEWFRPANTSTYYANETYDYYGSEMAIGDQLVLDEALAYLEGIMDLSVFDSDGNSVIDAVVMVTTLEINSDVDFYWAYRYWNVYTDDEGYYFEYDGVSANDYAWIPYDFMFEGYDEETGEVNYDKSNPLNPYTFIHEFGHVLGADDYYNTSYTEHPLGGADMMDAMQGDHNPYTKFNYGWLTFSKLITTKNEVTVTLDAFVNSGDTVIIANNWDEKLGAYQEYFVIMYYTNTGLNSGEGGYFSRDGIVVYHVNASLYAQSYGDETYYDVFFNNTDPSDQYGTEENLIEFVKHPDGEDMIYTYVEGDSLPSISDDAGNALGYTFTVDSLTQTSATLTFKALN